MATSTEIGLQGHPSKGIFTGRSPWQKQQSRIQQSVHSGLLNSAKNSTSGLIEARHWYEGFHAEEAFRREEKGEIH
jgi:hypothetical protein